MQAILSMRCDWVETFGHSCEQLHDLVDEKSVRIGIQQNVGDGKPMTAWQSKMHVPDEVAEWIVCGGHGYHDDAIVVIHGESERIAEFVSAIRHFEGMSTHVDDMVKVIEV